MSRMEQIDQLGERIIFPFPPKRIISLVPSQTELLYELGLEDEVVGITRFCLLPPEWQKVKPLVGGTKNFRLEAIHALNPDLVLGNKEENYQEGIAELKKRYPVWMSNVVTVEDALGMIGAVGKMTNRENQSIRLIGDIRKSWAALPVFDSPKTLYLIWRKPWMAAGGATFINSVLEAAGFENVLKNSPRYPEITPGQIRDLRPEVILLPSEPFPFNKSHMRELTALVPSAWIKAVDGRMFSWYGSRMKLAAGYFRSLQF